MPATTSYALLASGIASIANAYTQVNIASPFMHKNVDPIVFPGSYSDSHLHSFYGSDALNASSESSAFLRQGCTNAENINDLSVYWVPTLLYQSGSSWEPVPVSRFSAYYGLGDNGPGKDLSLLDRPQGSILMCGCRDSIPRELPDDRR